jgi:hypothetical protein
MTRLPFWKRKSLEEMTRKEWESLCDGCAKCCLVKFEDEETGALAYTNLHCKLLDGSTCQCSDYRNRKKYVPDCVQLTPELLATVDWLPDTCAYRLVQDGKDLPDWHHLVCGDRERIHAEGHSVRGKTVSEATVDEEDQEDWVIDWDGTTP